MSEQMIYEYDHLTGEAIVRPINEEEKKMHEAAKQAKLDRENAEKIAQQKRESAKIKLAALGLDEAEIEALLGKEPQPIER